LEEIRERLLLSQDTKKANVDKKHCVKEFMIGDWVWLHLQYRSAAGITPQKPTKLSPHYFGPYKIIDHIRDVAYRLQLPLKARIHDVFNVILLKKFDGNPLAVIVPLPPIQQDRVLLVPDKVLHARLNRGMWEILVSWQYCPPT
jgi:hypothetical protein